MVLKMIAPILAGKTLTVKLYNSAGSIVNGSGDSFTESSGVFSTTVAESLTGWHTGVVFEGSVAVAQFEIKMAGDDNLTVGESSQVAGSLSVGNIVAVTSFTAAAIAQLQGVTVSGSVPAITSFGFSDPIPRQSSWPSTRPLSIVVTGWTGPDLAEATSITLTGVSRIGGRKHTLSWSITPADVTNSGTTYTLPLVLTSTQTSVAAGEWSIQVVAVIDSKNYFVVNPNGKMTVIELGA